MIIVAMIMMIICAAALAWKGRHFRHFRLRKLESVALAHSHSLAHSHALAHSLTVTHGLVRAPLVLADSGGRVPLLASRARKNRGMGAHERFQHVCVCVCVCVSSPSTPKVVTLRCQSRCTKNASGPTTKPGPLYRTPLPRF